MRFFPILCVFYLMVRISSVAAEVSSINDWQGEWGQWTPAKKSSAVERFRRVSGGILTISDCSQEQSRCRMVLSSADCRMGEGEPHGIEMSVSPSGTAAVEYRGYINDNSEGRLVECNLKLKIEKKEGIQKILVEETSDECVHFCDKGGVLPKAYSFRSGNIYPKLWKKECFADNRASRQAWCLDAQIQDKERLLEDLGNQYEKLADGALLKKIPGIRETALQDCEFSADIPGCLLSAFENGITNFEVGVSSAQQRQEERDRLLAVPGNKADASKLIDQIAGVYKKRFANRLTDGSTFMSENILEIVRISQDEIYFKIRLEFFNDHTCLLYGLAHYTSANVFLFNDGSDRYPDIPGFQQCRLQFAVNPKRIEILSPGDYCAIGNCGSRGSFDGAFFPRSARQAIRYMKLLQNSEEYKESISKEKNIEKP